MSIPIAVLAVGLDPREADFAAMPQLTADDIRAYVEQQTLRVRELGVDVDLLLMSPGAAEGEFEETLRRRDYACIVVGAGLRNAQSVRHLALLEQVVNAAHRLAPRAKFAFNGSPSDTKDAVARILGRG